MRLFTGISIPPHVSSAVDGALTDLRAAACLRWSPVENLHITTKFIGAWPETRLRELQSTLADLDTPGPFSVEISGFGFLPNSRHPKIFYADVRADAGLNQLAAAIDSVIEPLGIQREERPYTPHLTLARITDQDLDGLRERISRMPPDFGSFDVHAFHLYESKASAYSVLSSYPLQKAAS